MRRTLAFVLLALASVTGPLLAIYIWIALWSNDQALWDSFLFTAAAWLTLPAAITAALSAPLLRSNALNVAVASLTSGAVGGFLTYVTFIAWAAWRFGS